MDDLQVRIDRGKFLAGVGVQMSHVLEIEQGPEVIVGGMGKVRDGDRYQKSLPVSWLLPLFFGHLSNNQRNKASGPFGTISSVGGICFLSVHIAA